MQLQHLRCSSNTPCLLSMLSNIWPGIVLSVGTSADMVGSTVWKLVSVCSAIYRLEAPTAISAGHPSHGGNWVPLGGSGTHCAAGGISISHSAPCTAVWEFGVTHSPCHRSLFSPCETSNNSKFWPNLPSNLIWDSHMPNVTKCWIHYVSASF